MFDRLKDRIFVRRVRQEPARTARFPRYEDVREVLIVYQSDIMEKNTAIKEMVRRLQQEGKSVSTWGYVDRSDVSSPQLPTSHVIGRKDVGLLGVPKSWVREELQKQEYDLMIDLTQHYCRPLHYVALWARCRFKTGRHVVDGLHDLMIDMPENENPNILYAQIMHFLTTIKSND